MKPALSAAQVCEDILREAIRREVSDIHFQWVVNGLQVRFRESGLLLDHRLFEGSLGRKVVSHMKVLADMNIAEKRKPQDGRAFYFFEDREVDLRLASVPTLYGENLTVRVLDREISLRSLDHVGLDREELERVRSLVRHPHGLILVTGPTGSGKSTTLAALLDYINSNFHRHIITIEEPIEFVHRNKKSTITQREVPHQTPTFADGLRAALREDADIVLVGEMRDLETISLALTAAETGLLVFGTLHTNNARKTVDRIIDAFPADQQSQVRTMLSASLQGVVAQLLMRRDDKPGRVAVNEILVATPAVSAIIREGATQKLYDVITGGAEYGMQFMDEAIWEKLRSGLVAPTEAYMKAIDKNRFKKFLPPEDEELGHASGAEADENT